MARLYPFASKVYRLTPDGGRFRVVTAPASANVLDGMGVVEVGQDCRVVSAIQRDSA
jgi:hypothetical protein